MSFVGKLLVVLQVVLSICFMAFAGAVYSTHKSWKLAHTQTTKELDSTRTRLRDTEQQLDTANADHKTEVDALTKERDTLIAENNQLKNENTQHLGRIDDHDRHMTVAQEQARLALVQSQNRNNEALLLRSQIKTLTESRHDELHVRMGLQTALKVEQEKVAALNMANKERLRDIALFRKALRNAGVSADLEVLKAQLEPPQTVDGEVQSITLTSRGTPDLLQISIGRDDGLVKGHRLYVYRGGKYLGEIEVVRTSPDIAVAKVTKPEKTGVIKEGDSVTTKL